MSIGAEAAIRDLLICNPNTKDIAKSLCERVLSGECSKKERFAYFEFLVEHGDFDSAIQIARHWFQNSMHIHWGAFFELLRRTKFKPTQEFFDRFFEALSDKQQKLGAFFPWEDFDPRLKNHNQVFLKDRELEASHKKQNLYEKLNYFSENRMTEEQGTLLKDLLKRFPDDSNLALQKNEFEKNWATSYIADKSREYKEKGMYSHALSPTADEEKISQILTEFLLDRAQQKPELAYDFSIGLYFMDLFPAALKLLEFAPEQIGTHWLRIELLLKTRRLIECLDFISQMEIKYADDPESTFAGTYWRAHTLKELGQVSTAIQLMRSLASVRPGYRSAQALLYEWEGHHQ
jgi:hypothetical protein